MLFDREDAQQLGALFVQEALKLTDLTIGYFIEGGGWDSSYNGVAAMLALEILAIGNGEGEETGELETCVTNAMNWQVSRISSSGAISTEGNTRVYEGGETFLGEEKGVDYAKTVRSLYYLGALAESAEMVALGDQVLAYYTD